MERFLKRFGDRVKGMITGFDRLRFQGTLQQICHPGGLDWFLTSQRVPLKYFGNYAQKLSAGLKQHAKRMAEESGRPYRHVESPKADKQAIALQLLKDHPTSRGLICVLSCVELASTFAVFGLKISRARRPCLHLYFYYLDRDFGLMHVRLQTWLPFHIQVCLNGREYLAQRLRKAGIEHVQRGNCFTHIASFARAQGMLNRLGTRHWAKCLHVFARRVNPLLDPDISPFLGEYYWTIKECEYATDIVFKDPALLEEIYPALIHHAITHLKSEHVLRFFNRRQLHASLDVHSDLLRKGDGLRVKHWLYKNSIKMYDKQLYVLRIEVTMNDPRRFQARRRTQRAGKTVWASFPLRRGVADIGRRLQTCRTAIDRYLDALAVVGETLPCYKLLDPISKPKQIGQHKYRGLRPISLQDAPVFEVIARGEFALQGFRNRDLRQTLFPKDSQDVKLRAKASARVSRTLALLRAHNLIFRVKGTSYYRITRQGHLVIATALKVREANLTLLAA